MFQDEEEAAMIADDSEIEWLLELYSPNISDKFNEAHTNNDTQEMQRLIAWALEHKFSDDWLEQVKIGFTLEDDRAVAVLTHNPDAPVKGMRLYYTKKEYEGDQFVGVIANEDPIYFSPDEEYPVNVSLYQSQSGRVDLERTESLVLPKEYYDIKEGLIPKDWWMAGFVDPYVAGIIDGAWEVLVGVYDVAVFIQAYKITEEFYWTEEAKEIRKNTKEFGKFLIELWKSEETRNTFKEQIKNEINQYIDNITCLEVECQYLQGKLIFDVATVFFGVSEAKTLIKGEKLTLSIVKVVRELPKNIGKIITSAKGTGLKIRKIGDDLIKIVKESGDEVGEIINKQLKIKYSNFGGDINCHPNKTTTAIGRFYDEVNGGGTSVLKESKLYKYGENSGGVNILDDPNWTWQKNADWLNAAIERGDDIRLVSDPSISKNIYIFKDGVQTDDLTTFGKEIKLLKSKGYIQEGNMMIIK